MKRTLVVLLILSCFATAHAQVRVAKSDTLAPVNTNRVAIGANTAGRVGQRASTGNFTPFAFITEILTTAGLDTRYLQLAGSYANPTWLTSLASSKVTGLATVATSGAYTDLLSRPTTLSGYGITDGLSATGSYSNPTWLTSLAYSKLTGNPTTLAGYGITDGVTAVSVIPVSTVATYANLSGVTVPASGFLKFVNVTSDETYGESNALYYITSTGKILKVTTIKEN